MAMQETGGDRLTQAMKRAGVTNSEAARVARVHVTTVSRWRNDVQKPEDEELDRVVELLTARGVPVTAAWIRYGANGARVRETATSYTASADQIVFASTTSAQKGRVWLEQFLLELAEKGASQEFIDSSRRLLMNPANYEHGFGAAAGHRDEMDDEQKLRHMQALAEGIRAALKERLKKGRGK